MGMLCDAAQAGADAFHEALGGAPRQGRQASAKAIRRLHRLLEALYGHGDGFGDHFADLCDRLGHLANARPAALRARDERRAGRPGWFLEDRPVAYMAYVDRFATDLNGVRSRIPHLQRLGVTYLHLLPFLRGRNGENDGGFAVRAFDEIEPGLGTMSDLETLCTDLHDAGIVLCADLVLNHVADDHAWARAAAAGDTRYQAYFHVLPDRQACDAYEVGLDQVFPEAAPGNFTHVPAMGGWVWTTFYPYQWDLNYAHFPVFAAMAETMLGLANRGIDVFRLDSAPFLWKRAGTSCANQPEVHVILQALRAVIELVAPGVLLKAEAVMPPAQVSRYLGDAQHPECHLAYHSGLMAAAWTALVEQRAEMVETVIEATPPPPPGTGWMTYVRCHDDIVWSVLKQDVAAGGRRFRERIGFVADFLEGCVPGSYARGVAFQRGRERTLHGTNGMTAALVGLPGDGPAAQRLALARFQLLYGLACWAGAIPMIFMGDELAQGNNDDARDVAAIVADSRWTGRPRFDETRLRDAEIGEDLPASSFAALRAILDARADTRLDPLAPVTVVDSGHPAVLTLQRGPDAWAVFNFSGSRIPMQELTREVGTTDHMLHGRHGTDLQPYGMLWVVCGD